MQYILSFQSSYAGPNFPALARINTKAITEAAEHCLLVGQTHHKQYLASACNLLVHSHGDVTCPVAETVPASKLAPLLRKRFKADAWKIEVGFVDPQFKLVVRRQWLH